MIERIPQEPPVIASIDTSNGPVWSVMITTYNCYGFLAEAIRSVLRQDPGEGQMQIEVIDDCSSDGNVQALVEEIGKGRVGYYRQPTNKGSLRNFETAINRSRGKYVHLLHGDDRVKPGYYQAMQSLLDLNPSLGAAFCASLYIGENGWEIDRQKILSDKPGILDNALTLFGEGQKVETPSIVVKRKVYEELGAFRAVIYGEDWDMWIRIAYKFPIGYTPEFLAEYRRHPTSISAQKIIAADNIRDLEKIMKLTSHYFPADRRHRIHETARYNYGWFAIMTANEFWYKYRNAAAARAQLRAAVRLSRDKGILLAAVKLYLKVIFKITRPLLLFSDGSTKAQA